MATAATWNSVPNRHEQHHSLQSSRRRYIARIKNVCIAIPFDPNETLAQFQSAVLRRASNHRKLRHDDKLSERIEFIKLRSPHFPDLIDIDPLDALCSIATDCDVIEFQTASDDELALSPRSPSASSSRC